MHIIFWQNIPSFHQSAIIRAIASTPGCEVTLALQDELPKMFHDGGWLIPDFGKAILIYPGNDDDISNLISASGVDAVHIFNGFRFPMVRKALLETIKTTARIGMIAEAADWRGFRGIARLLLYRLELFRFGSRIDFLLAMGQMGVRWYSRCGFPANKIYPFVYVVEQQTSGPCRRSSNETYRLIYVGQCIRRKGVDVLLSALSALQSLNWHLDIVGDGPERENLTKQAKIAGLAGKVTFHGTLQNETARQMVAESDCLVLPSRWDGWGAVVNEALMQGVPVICSDLCGASDLLRNPERGNFFKAGSVASLITALEHSVYKGKRSDDIVSNILLWSKAIEGKVVARYLLEVINGMATNKVPQPPWYDE